MHDSRKHKKLKNIQLMARNTKDFAIYEFTIFESLEKKMDLTPTMVQNNLKDRKRIFSSLFEGNKLSLYLDEVGEPYDNYKWKGVEDVFVYQVNNQQNKGIVKPTGQTINGIPQYDVENELSLPLGLLAIDNRYEDQGLIAIEKNAGWGKTPEKLRVLLEQSLSRILWDYGLDIKIEARLRPTEFWEFLDEQCNKNGDGVTKVTIEIDHKNKKSAESKGKKQRAARLMKNMDEVADKNKAIRSIFSMEFEDVNARKIKDMVHIAKLCDENDYELSVRLKKFGLYRSNETVTAFFPMEVEALTTFGWQYTSTMEDNNHTYQLMTWFDEVRKKIANIEDDTKTPEPRKRTHNKKSERFTAL